MADTLTLAAFYAARRRRRLAAFAVGVYVGVFATVYKGWRERSLDARTLAAFDGLRDALRGAAPEQPGLSEAEWDILEAWGETGLGVFMQIPTEED